MMNAKGRLDTAQERLKASALEKTLPEARANVQNGGWASIRACLVSTHANAARCWNGILENRSAARGASRCEVVQRLREELRDLFFQHGAGSVQVAKFYPYRDAMNNPHTWNLLEEIKRLLDPKGIMNPGALGLR
jgi:FAD-dependent oxidoreductase family protein